MTDLVPIERVENKIYLIRGQKVMLDRDLAELYGVSTSRLNEQVKRNINRFPGDFMISLTKQEILSISQIAISLNLRSQIVTSKVRVNGLLGGRGLI
ncbi:MAG: ORF6N domain-containing protein [Candidatus Margulisiibacteriota bacterium]